MNFLYFRSQRLLIFETTEVAAERKVEGEGATRSPDEGADTAVWLATLPNDGPTGGFFRDREPLDW